MHHGPIGFVDAFLFEQPPKNAQSLFTAAKDQTTAGVAVKAMGDIGQDFLVELEFVQMVFQCFTATGTGMNGQAGRLIDDDDIVILKQNGNFRCYAAKLYLGEGITTTGVS